MQLDQQKLALENKKIAVDVMKESQRTQSQEKQNNIRTIMDAIKNKPEGKKQ
jgi:hypothetical protein